MSTKSAPLRRLAEEQDRVKARGRPIEGQVRRKVGTWCTVERTDGLTTIFDDRELEVLP